MFAFSGFNGFGQFCGVRQRSVNGFLDFHVVELMSTKHDTVLIAPSWSYTAYAAGNQLLLGGLLSGAPNSTISLRTRENIVQLSACDRFCLVLLESGRLFKLRSEIDTALEEVKFVAELHELPQKRSIFGEPRTAPHTQPFRITHIACGSNITVAISNKNGVYSVPSKIYQFPQHLRVRQLLCGFEHALLLSNNGDIYSWGNGFRGQLGQDVLRVEEAPVLIEALAGIKIIFIAADGWHSAAISAFGDLYTWGFNLNGQLGLRVFQTTSSGKIKQPTVFPLPQIVELPECNCLHMKDTVERGANVHAEFVSIECIPVKAFAGARHTILQMSCGAIYATGWNGHGQLGLGCKTEFCDEFKKIQCSGWDGNCVEIVCSNWCTVLRKKV